MPNQYYSKIVVDGVTKIDLTGDTIDAAKILNGYTAHDKSGAPITGSCPYNADTSDTSASVDEVLVGETFYGPTGQKVTGTMPNRGAVSGEITARDTPYTVPQGYHDGAGTVGLGSADKGKLIAQNIRQGVTILGIEGTMSGQEGVVAQAKSTTPSFSQQVIIPDSGYTHLSQVTVAPIPVTETDNPQGGITLSIG